MKLALAKWRGSISRTNFLCGVLLTQFSALSCVSMVFCNLIGASRLLASDTENGSVCVLPDPLHPSLSNKMAAAEAALERP